MVVSASHFSLLRKWGKKIPFHSRPGLHSEFQDRLQNETLPKERDGVGGGNQRVYDVGLELYSRVHRNAGLQLERLSWVWLSSLLLKPWMIPELWSRTVELLTVTPGQNAEATWPFLIQCHFSHTVYHRLAQIGKGRYGFWIRVHKGQWEVSENIVYLKYIHRKHLTHVTGHR